MTNPQLHVIIKEMECDRMKYYYCPVADASCPYWSDNNVCNLENAPMECDTFYGLDEEEIKEMECEAEDIIEMNLIED